MLVKKELSNIPVLPFPKVKRGKGARGHHDFALAVSRVTLARSGEIFVADLFEWATKEPVLRFCSDGENFLCSGFPIESWGQYNPSMHHDIYSVDEEPEAKEAAQLFLNGKSHRYGFNAMHVISEWIKDQNREKRWRAADRKEELMKSHFAMYPKLPKDLPDYCDAQVFENRYLFISKIQKDGQRIGRCTCCGKHFKLPKEVKHNETGCCPKCGTEVTYKGLWYAGVIHDDAKICIAHNVDSQLLLRWVNVSRTFAAPNYTREYRFDTYAYNLYLRGGKVYFYKLAPTPYCSGLTWYRGKLGEYGYDRTFIYTENLNEVFGPKYYNVDLKAGLEGNHSVVSFCDLLNNLKNIPAAEYLFKSGLPRLASEIGYMRLIPDDAKFEDLFGLGREYIPILRKLNASMKEVKLIRAAGRWVPEETILKFRRLRIPEWRIDDLISAMKDTSFQRLVNYIDKQKSILNRTGDFCLQLWLDYIRMSKHFKVDLSHKQTMFPKNIGESHDILDERYNAVRNAALAKARDEQAKRERERLERQKEQYVRKVKELYELLPTMPYVQGEYQIVLPNDPDDLIREGQSLGHCVGNGTYADDTIRGYTMIIFIRQAEAPDKPFFTMEYDIRHHRIRQLYGFKNHKASRDVRRFAEGFIQKIRIDEDKKEKTA